MWKLRWVGLALFLTGAGMLAAGCGGAEEAPAPEETQAPPAGEVTEAVAQIEGRSGSELTGLVTFKKEDDGRITAYVSLSNAPEGVHAVHIHENGDCSAEDASSAGGHWNPTGAMHGKWGEGSFHLGDLGNVEVGEGGTGSLTLTTDLWSMGTGESNDILGKAVVVHEKADDFESQPSGAAGKRVGCGVIERLDS